jgi:HEAT repeat protein
VNLLQKDKIIEVKGAAAVALGKIGDIAAVETLVKLLQANPNDDNEFLRRSAARSIGQIAGSAQDNAVFKTAVLPLIKALQNPKEADDTRREAAYALGTIGDVSAIPALQSGTTSPDPYLAKAANEALLKIRDRP